MSNKNYLSDASMPFGDRLRKMRKDKTKPEEEIENFIFSAFSWLDSQEWLWKILFAPLLSYAENGFTTLPFRWLSIQKVGDVLQFSCALLKHAPANLITTLGFSRIRGSDEPVVGVRDEFSGNPCLPNTAKMEWPKCDDVIRKWNVFLLAMVTSPAMRKAFCKWMNDKHHLTVEEMHGHPNASDGSVYHSAHVYDVRFGVSWK